jgi:Mn2+/Fe2+ NRAMP family transporter
MNEHPQTAESSGTFVAPHPGSQSMPRWDTGSLPLPPWFTLRNWAQLLGPGLVMGGAAIGGGEWLAGPLTTAKYGGAILWLATMSILAQVIYNLEISRYTLYCGEPIFTGLFRVLPGPRLWLLVYLVLDFGSVFPYLVANAATPLAAVILGRIPNVELTEPSFHFLGLALTDKALLQVLKYLVFVGVLVPLAVGGKVYTSLKAIMTFKIVVVLGFLTLVAVLYSTPATWNEILTGFFKFGSVPVKGGGAGGPPQIDNIFMAWWEGRPSPNIDLRMIAELGALAAISGCGGLTNTSISGYTRDQGWGMARHVGAIPSVIGGRKLALSHVGMVFEVTTESVKRFRGWFRWVLRDQLVVWMTACFVGIALPSMLSVQFLPRGTTANDWVAAGMTADGVREAVGPPWGKLFWLMTLFCGFLVLAPSAATTADGVLRRWVDVFWTASPRLRKWEPHRIRYVYFGALCGYAIFGVIALTLWNPVDLLKWAGNIYNAALGFSCFHVLIVNLTLLPRELRPNWFIRIGLVIGGVFFSTLSVLSTMKLVGAI